MVPHKEQEPKEQPPATPPQELLSPKKLEPQKESPVQSSKNVELPYQKAVPVHEDKEVQVVVAHPDLKEYAAKAWRSRLGERWKQSVAHHYEGQGWAMAIEKEEVEKHNSVVRLTRIQAFAQSPGGEVRERVFEHSSYDWDENAAELSPRVNQWCEQISGHNPELA